MTTEAIFHHNELVLVQVGHQHPWGEVAYRTAKILKPDTDTIGKTTYKIEVGILEDIDRYTDIVYQTKLAKFTHPVGHLYYRPGEQVLWKTKVKETNDWHAKSGYIVGLNGYTKKKVPSYRVYVKGGQMFDYTGVPEDQLSHSLFQWSPFDSTYMQQLHRLAWLNVEAKRLSVKRLKYVINDELTEIAKYGAGKHFMDQFHNINQGKLTNKCNLITPYLTGVTDEWDETKGPDVSCIAKLTVKPNG